MLLYNYEQCFWEKNDKGVEVLLSHLANGLQTCQTIVNFFKQKSELEKDYSRRLGAINENLSKNLVETSDFGHLNETINCLQNLEFKNAQYHSKQSEFFYSIIYNEMNSILNKLNGKYTMYTGLIEKSQNDNQYTLQGYKDLQGKLLEAQLHVKEINVGISNQTNDNEYLQRKLNKWNSNVTEIQNQLNTLKLECKASKKNWYKNWSKIAGMLQDLESTRIELLRSKLMSYCKILKESNKNEMINLNQMIKKIDSFEAMDDIVKFSTQFGTGRLMEKNSQRSFSRGTEESRSMEMNSSHMANIRKLSSQLQLHGDIEREERVESVGSKRVGSKRVGSKRVGSKRVEGKRVESKRVEGKRVESKRVESISAESISAESISAESISAESQRAQSQHAQSPKTSSRQVSTNMIDPPENLHPYIPPSTRKSPVAKHPQLPFPMETQQLTLPNSFDHLKTFSSTSESSVPSDFQESIKKRQSVDSMATSVSSLVSNIDESQRFARSWNSHNRKRKSLMGRDLDNNDNRSDRLTQSENSKERSAETRRSSVQRVEYSMNRSEPIPRERPAREVSAGGDFPQMASNGEKVIKLAKALFPLFNTESASLASFDENDHLLITEIVNDEWYKGEVYGNEKIDPGRRYGLIPYNFIEIIKDSI
ncbi:hypothetical protein TBLA_0G01880 [Henningerozyma blattae CBS 6284]|uniref:SH3 domain-containing protein n=1 Tax=Henningerozyma blattae (strain ATCC 34711 / CBS 6284 / DSM 70876 / NBRC 10599 / NRRL Y-10934 / UCD 77-7) TaxID=1071380 RepID=I2H6X9_HENB6|nr:hypothetical protein TBLA_0G01880 [Tetrapisispora blattae CBS 6284]CCH62131.1 hypothetical protein TBLA_0G01880 [Tetrapisispora blattae CBS 6284]